jgi:hypothetical protein
MFEIPYGTRPVKFYPYPSVVRSRMFCVDCSGRYEIDKDGKYVDTRPEFSNQYRLLKLQLIDMFNAHNIKAYDDNKIAFECKIGDTTVFYGFYDWHFSIGMGVQNRI